MHTTTFSIGLAAVAATHAYMLYQQQGMTADEVRVHALVNLAAAGLLLYSFF